MASRVLVALRVKCTRERAFAAFTSEIAAWWRPSSFFGFTRQDTRMLRFEPGVGGRFLMTLRDGSDFEIGRIERWEPPNELVFSWRQQSFSAEQSTTVRVSFEPAEAALGVETRVTVEHFAWDGIPQQHAARHGLPLAVFQLRHAEWWQALLGSLAEQARSPVQPPA